MMSNTQHGERIAVREKPYNLMRDLAPISPINYSDLLWSSTRRCRRKTLKN